MPTTGYARTRTAAPITSAPRPERPVFGGEWEVLAIHRAVPATSQPWWSGIYCVAETDPGTTGQLRLRSEVAGAFTIGPTVRYEDFATDGAAATVLGSEWEIYDSVGNAGFGLRRPAQAAVVTEATATSNGHCLRLTAENVGGVVHSAGLKLKIPQTFGQYEVRVRVSDDASEVTSGVVILWPETDVWPRDGEIDWWETFDHRATRTPVQSYVHRRNPAATGSATDPATDLIVVSFEHAGVDQSGWHKIVGTWAPNYLALDIDNLGDVLLTDNPSFIPDWPMELTVQLDAWSNTPPSSPVTMDVDYVLVRSLAVPGLTAPVNVSGRARNVRLGFEGIPSQDQLIYVEGRVNTGTGGLRLIDSRNTLVSAPPISIRTSGPYVAGTGGGGGGGGGVTPVTPTSVRSTWQSVGQSTSHAVTPASFDPPAQPGDKIVFIGAAAGVTEVPSLTLTLPGSPLVPKTAGTGFNPQVVCTVTDYNASGWTLTGSFAFRAAAWCLRDAVAVAASAASEGSSPLNPASVAHGANALGMAVNVINYTGASVLTPATTPAAHEVVLATPIDIRQIHVASVDLSAAGTYDPGAATIGPGTESSVAFSLAAWPAAATSAPAAPTQPAWDPTGATTLNAGDNIASIVAAAAPGAKFILQAVTYTNWNDVRYKTGQHFRIPNSGTVTLEGTGFTWAGRAIDATGSSDNVIFSSGGGRLVVQNYGNGTARQEYGAFQAGPMDTGPGSSDYAYGVAQGWQLWNVDFVKNSAGGYRCSDYTVVSGCGFWGHTVSGLSYEMATGGRFHDCDFDANGLNPSTGAFANGAGCKLTWSNATGIRNEILAAGIRRAKAPLIFTDCRWDPTHAGVTGSGRIALWLDLDCQQVQVWNPTIGAHADAGIIVEGCNNVTLNGGSIDNCDGYGNANGENFIAGALTIGESQNVVVDGLAITNSVRAIVIRQSGRADWNGPASSLVAYTTKGWLTGAQEPRPGLLDQASQWTSHITIRNCDLDGCDRVILSEGANAGGMNVVGSLPVSTIVFEDNDYSGSTNIVNATSGGGFFDRSNSGISLTAWQAKSEQRDQ